MRQLTTLVIVTLSLCPAVMAADSAPTPCDLVVVRGYYSDRAQVDAVASWTEPWEVHHDQGYLVVGVDGDGFARLVDLGFAIEIDDKATAEVCTPRSRLANQTTGIPGYPCYRTVEETFATAESLVTAHPGLAEWLDIGDSWEKTAAGGASGYDMRVLRLTNRSVPGTPTGETPPHGKPKLVITASIHAREYTPAELTTRFAEWLINGYGTDPDATWLLDEHEVHLILETNPDGRKHAETGSWWRKNTDENYCGTTSTDRGADLNRNFPFQWGCCGGSSSNECDNTYRGSSPASEPEVQAVQNYLRSVFPDQKGPNISDPVAADATGVYLDLHSYSELVLWPWGFTSGQAPNGTALQTLGRRFAFFNDYEPEQSIGLYPTDGTTDDFAYGDLGVAAYTFELGTSFFQSCSTFENTIVPTNLPALVYAAKVARTPYLTPSGPVTSDIGLSPGSVVAPGDPVTITAIADDTRFQNSNGSEATQPITAAEVSVDAPPWRDPAPTPFAMTASDGSFSSTIEDVTATLDTTGLADGRHVLFVHSRDASGAWGTATAAFLWVLDPATAPHIAGVVTDIAAGTPVAAVVSAPSFSTTSDPVTGAYDLMLPAGTYELAVTASGYATATLSTVVATPSTTTVLDVALAPLTTALVDDVEAGNLGWTAEGTWAITTATSHSSSHSWTDSPNGDYPDDSSTSLTSATLDLSSITDPTLELWQRFNLESGYDYGYVEISTDGGSSWSAVATVNGSSNRQWQRLQVAIPQLAGVTTARIRFRLTTDGSVTRDGWYVDDISLVGVDGSILEGVFSDGFEDGTASRWSAINGG